MKNQILSFFNETICELLSQIPKQYFSDMEEIRLRIHQPLLLKKNATEYFVTSSGLLLEKLENAYIIQKKDISESMEIMSGYSLYAFEDEIKQAFIALKGGHRMGICGKTICEGEKIKTIKDISSLNLRICKEVPGCAQSIMKNLTEKGDFLNTVIASAPGCGKTTLLRDIIRMMSYGIEGLHKAYQISVIDERSEIGAFYQGIPQNNLGPRTDCLDLCPKRIGIYMALRSMSPDLIALDELGSIEDLQAVETALYSGVKILATIHASCLEDLKRKPVYSRMIQQGFFQRIVFLEKKEKPGYVKQIYDENLKSILRR